MPFLSFGMCWDFQLCQTQTPYAKTLRSWGYNFAAGSSCKTLQASLTSTLAFWVGKPVPHFVQAPLAENQPKLIPSKATARKPKPSCVHSWSNPCSQGHTNTSASPRDQPRDHHGAWPWPLHHGVSGVLQGTWVHGAVTEPLLGETEVTPGSGQPWLLWCQIEIVTEPKNARELFSIWKEATWKVISLKNLSHPRAVLLFDDKQRAERVSFHLPHSYGFSSVWAEETSQESFLGRSQQVLSGHI